MQKTIYSLPALREILEAANRRHLEFLSAIEDPRNGRDQLAKLSQDEFQEADCGIYLRCRQPSDEFVCVVLVRDRLHTSSSVATQRGDSDTQPHYRPTPYPISSRTTVSRWNVCGNRSTRVMAAMR